MDDQQIKELMDKIDQLIKALKDQGKFNYVNIEHADIQGPLVDKLDYNFDKLDVKEVSGALNLGTTFGVKVGEKKKKSGSSGTGSSSQQKKSKQEGDTSSTTEQKKQTTSQGSESESPKKKKQNSGSQEAGSRPQSREPRVNHNKPPVNQKKDQPQKPLGKHEIKPEKTLDKKEPPSRQNSSDQGKFKLSFRKLGLNEEPETKTTAAELPSEPKHEKEPTAPIKKKMNNTYKMAKRKSKKEAIHENTPIENPEQDETTLLNDSQPINETQAEPKKTVPFSSTKKGFTIKLR